MSVPLETLLTVAFLVPQDDPNEPKCPWGLNVMLWGPPGIGKSDRIERAAAMTGLPPRTVYAATTQPEDISGAAFANASRSGAMIESGLRTLRNALSEEVDDVFSKMMSKVKKPLVAALDAALKVADRYGPSSVVIESLLPGIADLMIDQQGVLFLDELSCARPAVQAAYLGVVLARRAGGRQLPPGVRIVAAANPADSAAGGWELEPPMANRFCHFTVGVPTVDAWRDWFISGKSNQVDEIEYGENMIKQRWDKVWPAVQGKIAGFLRSGGAHAGAQKQADKIGLHMIPEEGDEQRGRAWPSPRTWVFAARAMATCECLDMGDDVRDTFIAGCVGEGAATSFSTWLKFSDIPSPEDMIANGWAPDRVRLDRTMAAYTGLTSHVVSRKDKEERILAGVGAFKCFQQAVTDVPDIVLPFVQQLVRAKVKTDLDPRIGEVCKPVFKHLAAKGFQKYIQTGGS